MWSNSMGEVDCPSSFYINFYVLALTRTNAGIMSSNPTQVRLQAFFCVSVALCTYLSNDGLSTQASNSTNFLSDSQLLIQKVE
jgi:hypothetical protein